MTKDKGVIDNFVPGKRSSYMIIKFDSNDNAGRFVRYVSKNRFEIPAVIPLSGSDEVKIQKPWAELEKTEEESRHSSAVNKCMRTMYLTKESGSIPEGCSFQGIYGNSGRGNRKHTGGIVLKMAEKDLKVANVDEENITWLDDNLSAFQVCPKKVKEIFDTL